MPVIRARNGQTIGSLGERSVSPRARQRGNNLPEQNIRPDKVDVPHSYPDGDLHGFKRMMTRNVSQLMCTLVM